ncbi:MAG: aminopeptidase N C-terminal domain-containing protein [Actinomycetota bacterium]
MSSIDSSITWHLHHVEMRVQLDDERVVTESALHLRRRLDVEPSNSRIELDGRGLELLSLEVDGTPVDVAAVEVTETGIALVVNAGDDHIVRMRIAAVPGGVNDEGFTRRPELLSTNCEPQGFRRITYFFDHPGNRATFDVTLVGDPHRYPAMLTNGDRHSSGVDDEGRHWIRYIDPITKPSYLFAIAAGRLETRTAPYTTASGREIELRVAALADEIDGAAFALRTMADVLAFDEAHGGIEHDLDALTFVAVPAYPDATEYHGLMFFESSVLLVDTRGFVDDDVLGIIANVAHEWGHHVRGNRVTVRSWGQLALKEGLTVLTAQNDYRAHLFGPASRILDVLDLRRLQFPEELTVGAPVMRGEVRDPHSLYTRTTYLKGAEVFGMLRTLLGPSTWSRTFAEFVRRHDLESVGVDEFLAVATEVAPQHASDIEGVARWFTLQGRPVLSVASSRDESDAKCTTVHVRRSDTLVDDPAVAIPVVLGFHDQLGAPVEVEVEGTHAASHTLVLRGREAALTVRSSTRVVVSALRGYSAPVDLSLSLPCEQLGALMVRGVDPFTRWWASEELMIQVIDAHRLGRADDAALALEVLAAGLTTVVRDERDPLLLAQLLAAPDEFMVGDREPQIDVDGVAAGLATLRVELGRALHEPLLGVLGRFTDDPHGVGPHDIAARMLVEPVLAALLATGSAEAIEVARAQLASPNATRAVRALAQLAHVDAVPIDQLLASTYERWSDAPGLIDRWLRAQSGARRSDTVQRVVQLAHGPLYDRSDRSRVMAIWFPFATRNRSVFHHPSGAGYRAFVDEAIVLMPINAGLVVRLVGDLLQFQRFDEHRRSLMRAELERMASAPGMPDFAVGILRHLLGS